MFNLTRQPSKRRVTKPGRRVPASAFANCFNRLSIGKKGKFLAARRDITARELNLYKDQQDSRGSGTSQKG